MNTRREIKKAVKGLAGWTLRGMLWDEDVWHLEIDNSETIKEEDGIYASSFYPCELEFELELIRRAYDKDPLT